MKPLDYFPIEIIFNLLSVYRRSTSVTNKAVRSAVMRRGLWSFSDSSAEKSAHVSKIAFWVKISQSAGLLSDQVIPYPTYLAYDWLTWPFIEQMDHLLEAWLKMPESGKYQKRRADLLKSLAEDLGPDTHAKREMNGLLALGVCDHNELSEFGSALLSGQKDLWLRERVKPQPWTIEGEILIVPYPPDWELMWDLETYLDPVSPGTYLLDNVNLRQAVQRGALDKKPSLSVILTKGLQGKPPQTLLHSLSGQPTIRILQGPVLEFSSSQEVLDLRKARGLRKALDRMLSPRHVALDPWTAPGLLRTLYRKGLISESELELPVFFHNFIHSARFNSGKEIKISTGDRVYLLSVLILMERMGVMTPPPDLYERLMAGIPTASWATAAKQAYDTEDELNHQSGWSPEEELPPVPSDDLLALIQEVIDHQAAIGIMYRAPQRAHDEYRRISPLMLENRGGRVYLLAYCHRRRANRTFRVDRIRLIEPPA